MTELVVGGSYRMPNGILVRAGASNLAGVELELHSAGGWGRWAVLTGGAIVSITVVGGSARRPTATCQLTGWSAAELAPAGAE